MFRPKTKWHLLPVVRKRTTNKLLKYISVNTSAVFPSALCCAGMCSLNVEVNVFALIMEALYSSICTMYYSTHTQTVPTASK